MYIILNEGQISTVDDDVYHVLTQYDWGFLSGYAARGQRHNLESYQKILMHRVVMELNGICVNGKEVDHINRDRLDNRFCNLHAVDKSFNQHNSGVRKDNTSGIRGINHSKNGWVVRLQVKRARYCLGTFQSLEEAIVARDNALIRFNLKEIQDGNT